MKTRTLITPVSCEKISNFKFNKYLLLYLDKDSKLKRAIPDFNEIYIDSESSLIKEALDSDKFALFKINSKKNKTNYPVFEIYIDDSGEIINYNNYTEPVVALERILYFFDEKESLVKILKKQK